MSYSFKQDGTGPKTINMEATARNAMAELLCLPVEVQGRAVYLVAMLLNNPGDQVILSRDDKYRKARIIRLASDEESVYNLLLTH